MQRTLDAMRDSYYPEVPHSLSQNNTIPIPVCLNPKPQNEVKPLSYYVLPPPHEIEIFSGIKPKEKKEEGLTIWFVPDGNNRAGGDYKEGGNKVVEAAKEIAEKYAEVSTMVAWVLSDDNIKHRDEKFFNKICQAFLGLGFQIMSKGELVSQSIRMEIAGDLELLRQKGGAAAELANVLQLVCKLTNQVKEPKLTLKIGVGNDLGEADIIVRTGSETENLIRNSGLKVTPKVCNLVHAEDPFPEMKIHSLPLIYGMKVYWPELPLSAVGEIITSARNHLQSYMHQESYGFELERIRELITGGLDIDSNSLPERETVTIPYLASPEEADNFSKLISENNFSQWLDTAGRRVEFYEAGKINLTQAGRSKEDARRTYIIVPHSYQETKTYDGVIAVGQPDHLTVSTGVFNDQAAGGYTKFFLAGEKPSEVTTALHDASKFLRKYKPLKGKEREIEFDEFGYYQELQEFLHQDRYKNLPLEQVVTKFLDDHGEKLTEQQIYNLIGDFFVARMLTKIEAAGIHWESEGQLRACISYCSMCFFMNYYPDHPDHEILLEGWEERSEFLARYMAIVGGMDYLVYDAKLPHGKEKLISIATSAFITSVKGEQYSLENIDVAKKDALKALAEEFKRLSSDLKEQSSPLCFKNWQGTMEDLFVCHQDEWKTEVTENPLLKGIAEGDEEAIALFRGKYIHADIPKALKEKIEEAFLKLKNSNAYEQEGLSELKLYAYLCDIEQSIGAGLSFITYSCLGTKELDEHSEQLAKVKEICFLFNIFFRIANDMAEIFREFDDQEENMDSVQIFLKKYYNEPMPFEDEKEKRIYAKIKAFSKLKPIMDSLEERIWEELETFKRENKDNIVWKRMAIAMERGIKVGKAFYKDTHPTTADIVKRRKIFENLSRQN